MTTHKTKLYIIGNGFDLWHGIPSRYSNFKKYIKSQDSFIFETIERYLPVDEEWNELESALADLDYECIIDDLSCFMPSYGADDWRDSGHHDFQYEVEQVVERLSTELRGQLVKWIRTLKIPTPNTTPNRLSSIDVRATFLNFNYTTTIEDLYMVPDNQVLHIHGSIKSPNSELILGHAWNPAQHRSLNDQKDADRLDIRLRDANSIIDNYFSKTYKPSKRLIDENQSFFEQIKSIETVYVLGHSLSKVDRPYIDKLLSIPSVTSARWCVACRS